MSDYAYGAEKINTKRRKDRADDPLPRKEKKPRDGDPPSMSFPCGKKRRKKGCGSSLSGKPGPGGRHVRAGTIAPGEKGDPLNAGNWRGSAFNLGGEGDAPTQWKL